MQSAFVGGFISKLSIIDTGDRFSLKNSKDFKYYTKEDFSQSVLAGNFMANQVLSHGLSNLKSK